MTDIKLGFIISVSAHFLFFLSLSIFSKSNSKIYYIPVQVIGSRYGGGPSGGTAGVDAAAGTGTSGATDAAKQNAKEDIVKPGDIAVGKPVFSKKKITEKSDASGQPSGTGIAGTGTTGGGPGGIGVDAGNFPYMGYVNILRNKVAQNWNPSPYPSSSPKKVLVYFRILKDGAIENLTVKESAGVSFIDRSAIRAVTNSAPFPPLPAGYADDYLGVYFMFELSGS